MTPRDALHQQAAHCRRAWQALGPAGRATWPVPGDDLYARAWRVILRGEHPLAGWLDSAAAVETLPQEFPDGPSPRQLFSSHPFAAWHPWSIRLMFPEYSLTPLDS